MGGQDSTRHLRHARKTRARLPTDDAARRELAKFVRLTLQRPASAAVRHGDTLRSLRLRRPHGTRDNARRSRTAHPPARRGRARTPRRIAPMSARRRAIRALEARSMLWRYPTRTLAVAALVSAVLAPGHARLADGAAGAAAAQRTNARAYEVRLHDAWLVAAAGTARIIEPRLTGGFAYGRRPHEPPRLPRPAATSAASTASTASRIRGSGAIVAALCRGRAAAGARAMRIPRPITCARSAWRIC